jgi:hypothetical protein
MTVTIVRPVPLSSIDYPEGPLADRLEAEARRALPQVCGLDEAQTEGERMQAYAQVIEEQRDDFIGMYGDAFGWEKRSVPREASVPALGRYATAVVNAE